MQFRKGCCIEKKWLYAFWMVPPGGAPAALFVPIELDFFYGDARVVVEVPPQPLGHDFAYSDGQVVVEVSPQPLWRHSGLISHIVTFKWSWRHLHNHLNVRLAHTAVRWII
jgi:hypothetical protein